MSKFAVLMYLVAVPTFAAEPPDWYAHITAEQHAALLATRQEVPPHALIASGSVQGWRGPASAAYSAPAAQFDASALVHPPQYDLHHHNRRQAIVRAMLRENRKPDDGLERCWRVGKRDRL